MPQQGASGSLWPDFAIIDANGDGFVNRDEARAQGILAARWAEFDANDSGTIDNAEYIRARGMRNSRPATR